MKTLIGGLRSGSAAFIASGAIGPRILFAPDNEGGNGGGGGDDNGSGTQNGGGSDGAGNGGAGATGGDDGKQGGRGLFDRLRKKDGGAGDGNGNGGGDDGDIGKPGADGRPANIPEKFWNKETKALNSDSLLKAHQDLEAQFGKLKREKTIGGDVPEKATDYFKEPLKLADGATNFGKDGTVPVDDPGLKAWANICKKYGVGTQLASDMARDMFTEMNDTIAPPIDPDLEFEKLGPNGEAILEGLEVWIDGQKASGKLSAEDVEIADALAGTASGVAFLQKMRALSGADAIPLVPSKGVAGMSLDQWDSAYKEAVRSNNYQEQERLDKLRGEIVGDQQTNRISTFDPEKRVDKRK